MNKVILLLVAALLAGYALHGWTQSRIDLRSAVTPVGTSSSNGISFAWFFDPTDRIVYVCRAGQGAADTVDCKAKTQLP